ncbi:four-carbon acid sugar kinase family protein [Haloactinomyces albus]
MLALADDLSGAAEIAAALLSPRRAARIELGPQTHTRIARNTHSLIVKDLDSRPSSTAEAMGAVRSALNEYSAHQPLVFFKIDSLLRGNIAATVRAASDQPVVLAPALPLGGRTVVNGVLHCDGVPLHESRAWQAERATPPVTIADVLAPMPCRIMTVDDVRSGELHARLVASIAADRIPVCDSATDTDLDTILTATVEIPDVRLIGSGGLASALGRALAVPGALPAPPMNPEHALLIVVGTADPGAAHQMRMLTDAGVRTVGIDARPPVQVEPRPDEVARLLTALEQGPAMLTLDAPDGVEPACSAELVRLLAATVQRTVEHVSSPTDLVLTGGETARRVLDGLGIDALTPITQVHHGAVHSRTPTGTSVVTRPGSFGDADSLVRIVEHLRPARKRKAEH